MKYGKPRARKINGKYLKEMAYERFNVLERGCNHFIHLDQSSFLLVGVMRHIGWVMIEYFLSFLTEEQLFFKFS